jgi:hypothetical protein
VRAFDDPSSKGQPAFSMAGFGVIGGTDISCSKDEAKPRMKKRDHHKIVFELANETDLDLRFPKDADDAIWVGHDDRTCPKGPCANPEIKPQSVSPDGECLTVFNLNGRAARYKFSLVFEDEKTGQNHIFDPIWVNKNGGVE